MPHLLMYEVRTRRHPISEKSCRHAFQSKSYSILRSIPRRSLQIIAGSLLLLVIAGSAGGEAIETKFAGNIRNATVTVGRDASLSCQVEDLGNHKVGWIHLRRQMIVAVHTRIITRISRYSVTHDSHKTWTLHINGVTEDDRGYYMCQINVDPPLSQVGFLQVVVPPIILDEDSSKSEIQVREKQNIKLQCTARGFPEPRIRWKREDGKGIVANGSNRPDLVYSGATLSLQEVSRTQMGSYLCIASNGVPPSVSKRITIQVEFPPQIHVPNQLVGVPTGSNITIECFVEAFPKAISFWMKDDQMIMNSGKYLTETYQRLYHIHMKMTIFNFSNTDNTTYKCVAKNSLGETEGDMKLNEIYLPPAAKEIRSGNSERDDASYGIQSPQNDGTGVSNAGSDDRRRDRQNVNSKASNPSVYDLSNAPGRSWTRAYIFFSILILVINH